MNNKIRATVAVSIVAVMILSATAATTYSWFTDSEQSGINVIQSGNLDVVLEYKTSVDGGWETVTEDTPLFKEGVFYEPGYMEVVFLRISNAGSLSLKYDLNVLIHDESTSVGIDGKELSLKDHLEIGYYCMDESLGQYLLGPMFGTREAALSNVKTTPVSEYDGVVCDDSPLLSKDGFTPLLVTLVLTMPETVGNEANHKDGYDAPTIELGVSLLATQLSHEDDSFGSDYDEGLAFLHSGRALHDSTIKSGEFWLSDDLKTFDYGDDSRYGYGYEYIIRKGADYTLNLNGKTIIHDTVNENANNNALTYLFVANHTGTKLTINGDGKIHSCNSEGYACALQGKDGTLITVNGGDYKVDNGIAVWAGAGSHIIINEGSFVNGNAKTDHELIYSSGGVIDIHSGFFHNTDGNYTLNVEDRNRATGFINVYGGTFVNFDPSTGGQDPNNIKVMDGYKVVSETQENGDVWYTVVPE